MLTKLVVGLAQSEKKYGLGKHNNLTGVINLFANNDIKNLDTSLEYKNSHLLLENIDIKKYKLSIKLPKISNRKNLKSKIIKLLEDILAGSPAVINILFLVKFINFNFDVNNCIFF